MNLGVIRRSSSFLLLLCLFSIGCGGGIAEPTVAPVTGKITVDGKPGADLEIVFEPQAAAGGKASDIGGISSATTDAEGNYELLYKGTPKKGAVIGKHKVRITSAAGGGPAGGESAIPVTPLPSTYNTESTLTADVASGANTKDFELKTMP